MAGCFWNAIHVGPGNQNFTINGGAGITVASGVYASFLEFRNAFMTAAQGAGGIAALRSSISSTGHFTIDRNGGANWTLEWTDINLAYLLGFTANLGGGAQTFTAPRRIGASLYMEHGGGPTTATIGEHDPMPGLVHVTQTEALSGVRRTTTSGVRRKRATFALQFLDNTARFVSPSGAVATTYANAAAAAYDIGLTQYEHAKLRWWDKTNVAAQGWADGRRIRYFSSTGAAGDGYAVYALTAAAWAFTGTPYTDWTADAEACQDFPGVKASGKLTTKYHLTVPVSEYFD